MILIMLKNKPVIGILPTSNYMQTNDTFLDTYRFGNNYIKKIIENGGIPYLIPYVNDEIILESLSFCDGLLLPGGDRVLPTNFKVIDYFFKEKKPIFGICLGMQTLCMYSVNQESGYKRIIKPIDNKVNHWPVELLRDNNDTVVHKDRVEKDSLFFRLLGSEIIEVNSVHKNTVMEVGSLFKRSITSEDGLIEGIEYNGSDRFIIGVQFHPEILPQFNALFKEFLNQCKKKSANS